MKAVAADRATGRHKLLALSRSPMIKAKNASRNLRSVSHRTAISKSTPSRQPCRMRTHVRVALPCLTWAWMLVCKRHACNCHCRTSRENASSHGLSQELPECSRGRQQHPFCTWKIVQPENCGCDRPARAWGLRDETATSGRKASVAISALEQRVSLWTLPLVHPHTHLVLTDLHETVFHSVFHENLPLLH